MYRDRWLAIYEEKGALSEMPVRHQRTENTYQNLVPGYGPGDVK
jgi:hypothetical protein